MDVDEAHTLLGVGSRARADEVERAFRARAALHHPDRGGDVGQFRRLVEARTTLRRAGRPGIARPPVVIVPDVSVAQRLVHGVLAVLLRRRHDPTTVRRVR